MPRYELSLRVDACSSADAGPARVSRLDPAYRAFEERERAMRVGLAKRFGLKLSGAWMALASDAPSLDAFVAELARLRDAREAVAGSIHMHEVLLPHEEASCEWFSVRAQARGERDSIARLGEVDYPTVKAGDLVGSSIALDGAFINEHAARVLQDAGITGAELLWARDRGRWAAPQWYALIPTTFAGRGVDHPWFDRDAWLATAKPFAAFDHVGMYRFDTRHFRRDWSTGVRALDDLLRMVTPASLGAILFAPRRLLRERVPHVDVAWLPWDVERGNSAVHTLLVRRCVRDLLVERRLAHADDFEGVLLVDREPGVAFLDDTEGPPPSPPVAPARLASLRAKEQRLRAAHDAKPKAERVADLGRSLEQLRAAKKAEPERFRKPARAADIAAAETAVGLLLPASWGALFAITDGGDLHPKPDECLLHAASGLEAAQQGQASWVGPDDPDFPPRQFAIGWRADGDWYALDLSAVPAGERAADCPVVRWDHETATLGQRWDSVADFVERMLAG